jgi:hypothetical protein
MPGYQPLRHCDRQTVRSAILQLIRCPPIIAKNKDQKKPGNQSELFLFVILMLK